MILKDCHRETIVDILHDRLSSGTAENHAVRRYKIIKINETNIIFIISFIK